MGDRAADNRGSGGVMKRIVAAALLAASVGLLLPAEGARAQSAAAELVEMKSELVEMKALIHHVLSHTAKIVMSNAVAEVPASRGENTNLSQSLPQNFKYTEAVAGEGGGMR